MTLAERQAKMDNCKWELSQVVGHDTCGEYDYCVFCDKNVEFPCARAWNKFDREVKKSAKNIKTNKKKKK